MRFLFPVLCSFILLSASYAQTGGAGTIKGTVRTTDNQPASYVTIVVRENRHTVLTDEQGGFTVRGIREQHLIRH